jgi:hypothetical protein
LWSPSHGLTDTLWSPSHGLTDTLEVTVQF